MNAFIDKLDYYPRACLLELCYKCNLKCKHCGSSLNAEGTYRRGAPLTTDQFKQVISDLKDLGCKQLILTGGEPLLFKDWDIIAKYASGLELKVALISNGYSMTEDIVKRIKDSGIRLVALSLDGTKQIHNYMRNNPMAYDRVISAAKLVKKYGLQLNFLTTITTKNIDILESIEKTIYELHGDFWQLQIGVPMGQLASHSDLVISPERTVEVARFIVEAQNRGLVEITTADSIGYFSKDELILRNNVSTNKHRIFCGCLAGCYYVAIESNGNVKGCLSLQNDKFIEGNVKTSSIKDIWNNKKSFAFTRHFKKEYLKGKCKDCEYGYICRGGCSSLAFNSTGNLYDNPYCLQNFE